MATLEHTDIGENDIGLYISGLDTGWTAADDATYGKREVYLYANEGAPYPTESNSDRAFGRVTTLGYGVGQSDEFWAYNLKSGVEYYFTAVIKTNITGTTLASIKAAYETASSFNVSPWSWTSSNGEASSTQTRNAYTAVTSNGYLENFSYRVWNDMCTKVFDILTALGLTWYDTYGSYNNTLMSSSNKELTARRFNALRYNIGTRVSTGINEVSAGDTVRGSYFITLADKINDWIAQYS